MPAPHQVYNLEIISKKLIWFFISALVLVPGITLFMMGGLKLGIDFTGGSLFELAFDKPPATSAMREALQAHDKEKFSDALVTEQEDAAGQKIISIRSKSIDNKEQVAIFEVLEKKFGAFEQIRVEVVGPTIGAELKEKAIWATLFVMGMIVLYLTFRFSFDYGMMAIAALFHDVFIVLGAFSALGHFMGIEIDSLFVTAVLTVAGFSVHDTIVTFDRIRENAGDLGRGKSFEEISNDSVNQTITRSVHTSITTMFPLFCLTFFGGATIKYFSMAMLIGILVGTYSSIFIASPLLVTWREAFNPNLRKKKA